MQCHGMEWTVLMLRKVNIFALISIYITDVQNPEKPEAETLPMSVHQAQNPSPTLESPLQFPMPAPGSSTTSTSMLDDSTGKFFFLWLALA